MEGGLAEMMYLPEYVSYFCSVNADKRGAFGKIGDAIRSYIGVQQQVGGLVARRQVAWRNEHTRPLQAIDSSSSSP